MKTKIAITVAALLLTTACEFSTKVSEDNANDAISQITYKRDDKTGLCFAFLASYTGSSGYSIISFTAIPCDRMPQAK